MNELQALEIEADAWDEQIEHDLASGRLDDLFDNAIAEHLAGHSREI